MSRPQVNNVLSEQVKAKRSDGLPISLPNSILSLKIISGADKDLFHVIATELCWSAPKDNCCFPICLSESFCMKGKQIDWIGTWSTLRQTLGFGCLQIGQQLSVEVGDVDRSSGHRPARTAWDFLFFLSSPGPALLLLLQWRHSTFVSLLPGHNKWGEQCV